MSRSVADVLVIFSSGPCVLGHIRSSVHGSNLPYGAAGSSVPKYEQKMSMNASTPAKQLTGGAPRALSSAYQFWCKRGCADRPRQERWLLETPLESGQEDVFQGRKHAVPGKMWYHYTLNTAYIFNICLKKKACMSLSNTPLEIKIQLNSTTFSIFLEAEKNGALCKKLL